MYGEGLGVWGGVLQAEGSGLVSLGYPAGFVFGLIFEFVLAFVDRCSVVSPGASSLSV